MTSSNRPFICSKREDLSMPTLHRQVRHLKIHMSSLIPAKKITHMTSPHIKIKLRNVEIKLTLQWILSKRHFAQFGFAIMTGDGMASPRSDKHARIKLVALKNKTPHDKPQGPKGSISLSNWQLAPIELCFEVLASWNPWQK